MSSRIIAFLLAAVFVFGTFLPASATGIEELEKERERQEKIADKKYDRGKELLGQIADVNEKISECALKIDEIQEALIGLDERIEENGKYISGLIKDKEQTGIYLNYFIRRMYYNRHQMDLISVFLRSHSIIDFINQQKYAKEVSENFYSRLREYAEKDKLAREKSEELKSMKVLAKAKREALQKQQDELDERISGLSKLMEDTFEKASEAMDRADELDDRIEEMKEAEKRALEAQAKAEEKTWEPGDISESSGGNYYSVSAYPYTDSELKLLAGLIQAEAGSTSYPGMIAVGSVVMNRLADSRFPNTISGVIYAPHQFSPAGSGRLAVILAQGPVRSCYEAARDVLEGKRNVHNLYFKATWYAKEHGISGIEIGGNVFH